MPESLEEIVCPAVEPEIAEFMGAAFGVGVNVLDL